jgi:hypothetical protein
MVVLRMRLNTLFRPNRNHIAGAAATVNWVVQVSYCSQLSMADGRIHVKIVNLLLQKRDEGKAVTVISGTASLVYRFDRFY